MVNIDHYDAFCFDLDGTIFLGDEILPGAKDSVDFIRAQGKKVLFITNSPTLTRKGCQEKLERLGVASSIEEVFTASYIAALYFTKYFPESSVYVVGEKAIKEEFKQFSLQLTEAPLEATHVIVGLDRSFNYEKLNAAMTAVRNGAKLIVTNPDPFCPVPGGFISDTLAIARAIETASGHDIFKVIGKPSTFYGDMILTQLNVSRERCLIIGDRLETDIMLGKLNAFRTCLVLTGVASHEDIEKLNIFPDYIIQGLQSMFAHLLKS
ncbi:HAD-IIA family hydrolase [Siminovitchia sp. FSL H7-0308]|uniref:Acid sugar phosphatase n=1 Tax=Siminovitchia thermophila TaxID=1245522 RepID=A0ABS2R367_9BACI|nr:HAD-IIA family hydrolase [Siminovitchia thermophila]MBM7714081.1 phosphoglycolate/pyridoxal phosphate phosphatase family enzyme [Siminovitchia thermophila]ONK21713.1 haloacid dehalogenase [Bacillus sp. VT-16-64]